MLQRLLELLTLKWLWDRRKDAADLRQHSPASGRVPTVGALGRSQFSGASGWLVLE
jgi:hypothetical protein